MSTILCSHTFVRMKTCSILLIVRVLFRINLELCNNLKMSCSLFVCSCCFIHWFSLCVCARGSRDGVFAERRTRDRKVASSNPGTSGRRVFYSRVSFLCWLLIGIRSTPVLPQWYVKDPGHSSKSAGGRWHLNTHTPLTQRSRSGLTMPLSRHIEILREPIRKRAHTQLVRKHSPTVVSARWAAVDRSWRKECN